MPSDSPPPGPGEYTIDDLAARTGIPSRTIRFYQARGVLPAPRKQGRVAYYDDTHVERLKIVGELQDKGLRLRAIRDFVSQRSVDNDLLRQWLGVGEHLGSISHDTPQLFTEEELKRHLGNPPPGVIAQLVRRERIQPQGEGVGRRYLVESPALIAHLGRLLGAGIDLDTVLALHDMLEKRLSRAAREMVEYAMGKVGRGFGKSAEPGDVDRAVKALFDEGIGADAVSLIFTREVQRAVQEALQMSPQRLTQHRRHDRR